MELLMTVTAQYAHTIHGFVHSVAECTHQFRACTNEANLIVTFDLYKLCIMISSVVESYITDMPGMVQPGVREGGELTVVYVVRITT